ncbi:bactofilin family protein [Stakelama saccharophila]|uniref:Polymer-forming cytoskeletal protein n=1 Tax=Stakelama saccharophila TaxID=3075605 RepID=A0ABZ0BEM1_9SPHN|nr:polymer-forming cytoskeletal protein [Stakelama sp. W311]WNO54849.1 polymer-forming cytoskeletal protein [Stakelama sp. W311]
MIKKKDKTERERKAGRNPGSLSVLGADLGVKGDLSAEADLHIEGRVEGDIDCRTLILGAGSHVTGGVTAGVARVAGRVDGGMTVDELTIERGATVAGDITYATISVEAGARIDGTLSCSTASQAAEGADDNVRVLEMAETG